MPIEIASDQIPSVLMASQMQGNMGARKYKQQQGGGKDKNKKGVKQKKC